MDAAKPGIAPDLPQPPSYLGSIAEHFRSHEADLWKWFGSSERTSSETEAVRLDLLKSTYRLDPPTHGALYALAAELVALMKIRGSVTLYQASSGEGINAFLAYLPGEAHVVLRGPVLTSLDPSELRSLLAHELAHFLLFDGWEGKHRVAGDLLRALSQDASAGPEFAESARLFSLYSEIFADQWALQACGDLAAVVRTLVKAQTGIGEVNADGYLQQAAEIFAQEKVRANAPTHPELFIRARALQLRRDLGEAAAAEIARMIEGPAAFDRLDLLRQRQAIVWTRQLLDLLLAPAWFRTEAVLAHARQFFPEFGKEPTADHGADLASLLKDADASLQDYCVYLLLDFVTVDRDLGDAAVAAAILTARTLNLEPRFVDLAAKEIGLGKKLLAQIALDAPRIVDQADAAFLEKR